MEGEKQAGQGQHASERIFTILSSVQRRKFRRRQITFSTVHPIPPGYLTDKVDNNSSAIKIKKSATSTSGGEEYWENNNSRKRGREKENGNSFFDIPGGKTNFRRPEIRFATAHPIPAGDSAAEVANNSRASKIRRYASLREQNSQNSHSRRRRSLSTENENIKILDNWLSRVSPLSDRVRADLADSAGAAEQFPSVSISEEHINNNTNCTICLDAFEFGEDACEMPCSHIFHKKCIFEWISRNPTCPVCRYNFLSPPSASADNDSRSYSAYLSSSDRFSAYQSYSKEYPASPSGRSPAES